MAGLAIFKISSVQAHVVHALYGRTLARVYCEGVDANAEQVRRGIAWVFDRYVTDRSLYSLQNKALAAKRGLWAEPRPVPMGVAAWQC